MQNQCTAALLTEIHDVAATLLRRRSLHTLALMLSGLRKPFACKSKAGGAHGKRPIESDGAKNQAGFTHFVMSGRTLTSCDGLPN
jgi:hypothetical protein